MDSNQLPYFLLREPDEFQPEDADPSPRLQWNRGCKAFTLAQNQELRLANPTKAASLSAWEQAKPLAMDSYGQLCRIHDSGTYLEYNAGRAYLPLKDDHLALVDALAGRFTDLAINAQGRLAAGYSDDSSHGLLVFHLAKRWQVAVALPEKPQRVWVDNHQQVWVLGPTSLMRCCGEPLPHDYIPRRDRFEPEETNPHPLALVERIALRPVDLAPADQPLALLTNDEQTLALCADSERLYLLTSGTGTAQAVVSFPLDGNRRRSERFLLEKAVPFALDMGWISPGRLALLPLQDSGDDAYRKRDCAVVELVRFKSSATQSTGRGLLIRERYPMLSQAQPRFIASADGILRYQARVEEGSDEAALGFERRPRELHVLQRPRYFATSVTKTEPVRILRQLDSGLPNQVWHRVYLEGRIPPGSRLRLFARAYNSPGNPEATDNAPDTRAASPFIEQPDWVWCPFRSDQPFGKGLVDAIPGEAGLFETLLQRDGGPVRRLAGRYLELAVVLESDGRFTPAIHALKVYYPRFSYQEAYLPEHFRQEQSVDTGLDSLPANGADVRERLLAAFEASWTPLEAQIASAEILLHPLYTPAHYLPLLAQSLGQTLPPLWPEARQRRWLLESGRLQQWRGTLPGLNLALDILTDGAVARGQVIVVENYRLRRTFATILGVLMDDAEHPLTLGTGLNGNSIVGDSLILADGQKREFLSLFAPEVADADEQLIVEDFFDRYAHRVTVLLHGPARKARAAVEECLAREMPAHLHWQLVESDHPFVLGLSPLLGVDTYLETQPPARPVILDDTWLGEEGLLINAAAFSPRDVNSQRRTGDATSA
ncbi:phage tail protein [Cellvibrio japonicus]|uniref:Phage tail protein n=1 Tax=Cellvibrio japonicus (strain Ueda107) TaxID=498211 RepID=B3PD85_CELJU|nr:phage tail protein [Cellvibrio japonicus]ACE84538.1 hypothetical protein CJA_3043 [Cellvibrio japonicus Ueda107]QEI13348.1 phage tail protein [Cellvibrio japonicus]QEI16922.1 phage tail protein [Cellvibrio japonicus]QEI20500.1 phage tail protein [Cellvibrio japonicus]